MKDLLALLAFALFVLLCTWVVRGQGDSGALRAPPGGRRRVSLLVAYATILSVGVGVLDRQAWPFASWVLMPDVVGEDVAIQRILAIDSGGEAHRIDHRAWAPLSEEELMAWIRGPFARLPAERREEALTELLAKAEAARQRVLDGGAASAAPGLLGPLGASTHILHPARWTAPSEAPRLPFTELQVVEDRWNVLERRAGTGTVEREVLFRVRPTR